MSEVIAEVRIPDTRLAREAIDLLREHGTAFVLAHSLRVYRFGSIRGRHRGLQVDQELLYRTMNTDVLERTLPGFRRHNFCKRIAANPLGG